MDILSMSNIRWLRDRGKSRQPLLILLLYQLSDAWYSNRTSSDGIAVCRAYNQNKTSYNHDEVDKNMGRELLKKQSGHIPLRKLLREFQECHLLYLRSPYYM